MFVNVNIKESGAFSQPLLSVHEIEVNPPKINHFSFLNKVIVEPLLSHFE